MKILLTITFFALKMYNIFNFDNLVLKIGYKIFYVIFSWKKKIIIIVKLITENSQKRFINVTKRNFDEIGYFNEFPKIILIT
jgi:hypothetical protein